MLANICDTPNDCGFGLRPAGQWESAIPVSRTKSIEELPVALGFCLSAGGDFRTAVLGAVNYGRDADSIATMAGAICAALGGAAVVPQDWVTAIEDASRLDLDTVADQLTSAARDILTADRAAAEARRDVLSELLSV